MFSFFVIKQGGDQQGTPLRSSSDRGNFHVVQSYQSSSTQERQPELVHETATGEQTVFLSYLLSMFIFQIIHFL